MCGSEASGDDVEEMFDRGGGAVREEEGGRGTAGSSEEGAESGTEHDRRYLFVWILQLKIKYGQAFNIT